MIPRIARKQNSPLVPTMASIQKFLTGFKFDPGTDTSKQQGDLLRQKARTVGKMPTQYAFEAAKGQAELGQAKAMEGFYKQNPVPQMPQRTYQEPTKRDNVPLPPAQAGRTNENAGRFASALTGLFAPNVDTSATISQGFQKDQLAYQNAQQNYQLALDNADKKYRDEQFARQQALDFQAQEDTKTFNNALARYGQLQQEAVAIGNRQGLEGTVKAFSGLDEQVRTAQEGALMFDADLEELRLHAKSNADSNEAFLKATDLLMKAEQLEQQRMSAEADALIKEAMVTVHKEAVKTAQQEREQSSSLFTGKMQGQALQNRGLESALKTDEVQRGNLFIQRDLMKSQAAENYANASKIRMDANAGQSLAKATDLNAFRSTVLGRVAPFKDEFDSAEKAFREAAQQYNKIKSELEIRVAKGEVTQEEMNQSLGGLFIERDQFKNYRDAAYGKYVDMQDWASQTLKDAISRSPLARDRGKTTNTPRGNGVKKAAPPTGIKIIGVR